MKINDIVKTRIKIERTQVEVWYTFDGETWDLVPGPLQHSTGTAANKVLDRARTWLAKNHPGKDGLLRRIERTTRRVDHVDTVETVSIQNVQNDTPQVQDGWELT